MSGAYNFIIILSGVMFSSAKVGIAKVNHVQQDYIKIKGELQCYLPLGTTGSTLLSRRPAASSAPKGNISGTSLFTGT